MTTDEFHLPPQQLDDDGYEDPDVAGRSTGTTLAGLAAELSADLAPQEKTWKNPNRAGWAASYRLDLSEPDLDNARKRATLRRGRRGQEDEIAEVKQLSILLARYNTAVLKDGEHIGDGGEPVTFRDRAFQAIYGVGSAADAVKRFYGTDGAVIAAGRTFTRETGWLDDADEVGDGESPTRR